MLAGAEKAIDSCVFPAVIDEIVGAPGVVTGVPEVDAVAEPEPAELTALNWTLYAVPFVSPVITKGEVVDAGDRVVQVEPPLVEYS